jgi:polysaccharide biosynthesis protein PelA
MGRRFKLLITLAVISLAASASPRKNWVVYYSDHARPDTFRPYDLVVFDSDTHPPVGPVIARGATVLGYLSLCEVEQHRKYFAAVKEAGILAGENPNWPGSYFVDVRDARWRKIVVSQLAPEILAHGFQGLFLDTLDDAANLENRDPKKFRGMKAAAIQLVGEIRHAMPAATLMVNRGYDLLPEIAGQIDIALGESVYGTYDFATKKYHLVPPADYQQQVAVLSRLKLLKPSLRICTLDYWDPADQDGIRRIYREERSRGFDPYVATIDLDRIVTEPR